MQDGGRAQHQQALQLPLQTEVRQPDGETRDQHPCPQLASVAQVDYPSCAMSSPPYREECEYLKHAMGWQERTKKGMNKIMIRRNIKVTCGALYLLSTTMTAGSP